MVNNSEKAKNLKNSDYLIAGAFSGSITRGLLQPLDVLKIRFQLQVEPITHSSISKYRSVIQAVFLIRHEEGIKTFWKGHVPAQLLSIVYGGIQFWCYETLSHRVNSLKFDKSYTPLLNLLKGSIAGSIATVTSFPFDVVRTRLVAQDERHKLYSGVANAFMKIFKTEGVQAYFKGLTPTIVQVAPHAGIQFMCYNLFKVIYKNYFAIDHNEYNAVGNLLSGSLAGLCAKTAIYPLDLTRKRMQIQGFEECRKHFGRTFKCKGMLDCLYQIYTVEGFIGLYKGLSPSLFKAVTTTALHFATFEYICKLLEYRY